MLGTAPSGSVQLQDYCVRPEKNGEPYFCYYRLLPQVARTYLCTRNLSDSPVVIAFIGYRCPASSEAFPLRLPSPVYHVLTCIHRKRSHAPEETGAVTVIQSFGDCRNLAPQRSWDGLMTGRNLSPQLPWLKCRHARLSFLILRWQRVLFDQSTLVRMNLTRRSSTRISISLFHCFKDR